MGKKPFLTFQGQGCKMYVLQTQGCCEIL